MPVCIGYLAVSFTLGIVARKAGISPVPATIMSLTNLTSAGEFAAISLIAGGAAYIELALTQLIINLRYMLMSCALSQKVDPNLPLRHRLLIGVGITDEIFGLAITRQDLLSPSYFYGIMAVAVPGWTLGTAFGAYLGGLLPTSVLTALSVALYGMFISIIIPAAKENKIILGLEIISMGASYAFSVIPGLKSLSEGLRITILTAAIAGIAAVMFPRKEEPEDA
ncbi:Predicted branched-chain amino acid permease (azaleucine resistance) [Eubacterium oxidoreducens]|uniref:Predicted branched-chain amino acid permease (Azaleucine resistance) n=2 Tax=Eubacterium oxidoreducens TaxID=1732 RepID=A0A1G6BCQ2_EUBOX|nr:Predicted branched-chain amino acid permease (azaleucine resistance) [Eubacterium oxidoreducens]